MKNRSSDDGVGGGRGSGMQTRISTYPTMQVHHGVNVSLVPQPLNLRERVARAARHALDTNEFLTPKQKQQLRDIERGRYPTTLLEVFVDAMAGAKNPLMFAEQIEVATLDRVAAPTLCVLDTYLTNTRFQKDGDMLQALFLTERTGARQEQLLDGLGPEEVSLRAHRQAVMRWNPTGRRIFAP